MPQQKDFFVHPQALVESNTIGRGTRIWAYAHVQDGAVIGDNCNIGDHCYVEGGANIGDETVVKNGVSIWEGTTLGNRVFIGPNVAFTNDLKPRAKAFRESYDRIQVKDGASVGANATLIAPLTIGIYAFVGGGAVVIHDVPDFGLVLGNPARLEGFVCRCAQRLPIDIKQDGKMTCSCGLSYQKQGLIIIALP